MEQEKKVFGTGTEDPEKLLSGADMARIFDDILTAYPMDGKRVLVLIPDHTRTMPLPIFFQLFYEKVYPNAAKLDFLIALERISQ